MYRSVGDGDLADGCLVRMHAMDLILRPCSPRGGWGAGLDEGDECSLAHASVGLARVGGEHRMRSLWTSASGRPGLTPRWGHIWIKQGCAVSVQVLSMVRQVSYCPVPRIHNVSPLHSQAEDVKALQFTPQ